MPNHFILIEDPADRGRRRVSEYTAAELSVCFSGFERAHLAEGGFVSQPAPDGTPRIYTDMLAYIDLARAAEASRIARDIAAGESPLRRALREAHLRRQHQGVG